MYLNSKLYKSLGVAAALMLGLSSCHTPTDVTYFQDISDGSRIEVSNISELVVAPYDEVMIAVHSKDPQLAQMFNLSFNSTNIGNGGKSYTSSVAGSYGSNTLARYVVNSYGDIDFPVLGTLHIAGLKRSELADYIKNELIQRNYIKDPVVIIDFANRAVNVLGEVSKPGKVTMDRDNYTILDAIAGAGDLSINGKRENVLVIRMEDGRQVAHSVDLTNAQATMSSPVYYLKQNDVIYVEPNDYKKRQTTVNGNSLLTPSFWISIASFATTLVLLIKNW
jgi:polysaccharide export outer membrane protein